MKTKFNGFLTLLLALVVQLSFAQEKTIKGNVSDESGPLPGVSIIIKGTTKGAETDFDGNYTLQAKQGDVLVYSYVGLNTVEKTVGASNTINVVMTGSNVLEEVVIMGYGASKKTELTGSTVQIKSDDIAQTPVATVDQVLQGKVAGLTISGSSGTPGSTQNIRIRGVSSITAGNEPLYVIDGVPANNPNLSGSDATSSLSALSSLNSNNIESITVLKDASATAAYGARGANGVIVITTKTGKQGKTQFNFSTTYGVQNDAVTGPVPLTGAEREMLAIEAIYNTYKDRFGLKDKEDAKAFFNSGNFGWPAGDYEDWRAGGRVETNWGELITNKNAPVQEYNLSATGGEETYNFFTSLGYYKQEATVIGSKFDRISGQFNFSKDFTDKLKFSTINSASHTYQDGLLESSAYFSSPRVVKFFMPQVYPAYTEDGKINLSPGLPNPNPLWIAKEDIDDNKITRIITNNSLAWDTPIENLKFTTRANIDYLITSYKSYDNPISGDGDTSNGRGTQSMRNYVTYVFQNSLDYVWNINDDHKIDFKVLQEWQKNRSYLLAASADNFAGIGLTNLNSAGNPSAANSTYFDWAIASYLGMAHYSAFNGRYVLDATYRREGSSRFAPKNRWGNFWSVGGAWNIHKEKFMEDVSAITNLKLRASYGVTGNAAIDLNSYQALLGFSANYNGEGASFPSTFGNENLSWETSNTLDLGLEFGFLDNRIKGSFGYYKRNSKDLLLNVPLSSVTGFSQQTRNIGEMENKGFEAEINFDIVRSEDFNLSLGGNLATTDNKVLKLAKDLKGEEITITGATTRVASGHPVYAWYMPTWAGVNPDTGDEEWFINGVDGDKTANFNKAKRVFQGGSAIPKITAGLNMHVDYKGFFLDANAYYAGGHKVYEEWHRYTQGTDRFPVVFYQGYNTLLDRWQKPGDKTRFGKFEYTNRPWQRHSKFLYAGDYLRIKNVTFGYDFNQNILESLGVIDGLRVFVKGTNLFTWVKDENLKYDPEIDASGFTGLTTPPVKSFVFGINVKF